MAEVTKAELQDQLTGMTKRAESAEAGMAAAIARQERAEAHATDLAAQLKAATAKSASLEGQVDSLSKSLRAYKGSATRAQSKVEVLKAQLSPESRRIGELKAPRTDEEAAERAAAIEAAFAGGPVEIAFSDGRKEIREIAPLICTADAFRQTPRDRELNSEPVIELGGERLSADIAGFGLLNEAGDQVAYCRLPSSISILRGQHMRLPVGTIRF